MRYLYPEDFFHFGLVQDGEMRSPDPGGEFVGVAGPNVTDISGQVPDGAGKVEPGADTFVRVVVDTLLVHLPLRDDPADQFRQIARICGRSHLVEHDLQRRALGRELPHRLHEILPVRRVEPGRPENLPGAAGILHRLFALKLCRPIHAIRMHGPVLPARECDIAMEDVIRGDVDEMRAPLRRHAREDARGKMIQEVRHLYVLLGLVNVRVSRAIDDHIDLFRLADEPDRVAVGDVQIDGVHPGKGRDVREDVTVGGTRGNVPHLGSQLSVRAGNQYVHMGIKLYSPA